MGTTGSSLLAPRLRIHRGRIIRCELVSLVEVCAELPFSVANALLGLPSLPPPPLRRQRPNSLKWKPPSENSIDFLLQLKFPALANRPEVPDYTAKPVFMLMMNHGHEGTHYYDTMEVDDETWEG